MSISIHTEDCVYHSSPRYTLQGGAQRMKSRSSGIGRIHVSINKLRFKHSSWKELLPDLVEHTFNSSTQRQRQEDLCEFKVIQVYTVRSRTFRTAYIEPVSYININNIIIIIINNNNKIPYCFLKRSKMNVRTAWAHLKGLVFLQGWTIHISQSYIRVLTYNLMTGPVGMNGTRELLRGGRMLASPLWSLPFKSSVNKDASSAGTLILGFPVSRTINDKCQLLKPASWCCSLARTRLNQ